MARFSAALALLALLTACGPKPSGVTSVTVDYIRCFGGCASFDITIARDGAYAIPVSFRSSTGIGGTASRPLVDETFSHLPLGAVTNCTQRNAIGGTGDSVSLIFGFGSHRSIACQIDASGGIRDRSEAAEMRAFATMTMWGFYQSALAQERSVIRKAVQDGNIDSIELSRTGCFGSCPSYNVRFTHDGNATINTLGPPGRHCGVHALAVVPFAKVVYAVREGAEGLQPRYPHLWTDSPGAKLTLMIHSQPYVSEGTDSQSWGPSFTTIVERLDQIVLDAKWTPLLPPRAARAWGKDC